MLHSLLSFLLASTLSLGQTSGTAALEPTFDDRELLSVTALPLKKEEMLEPGYLSARARIAVDVNSQTILYEHNSDLKLPIASLTKLMTAYIILQENDPESVVVVSPNAAATEGSSMDLLSGETITVKNLLYGLLIESGNDAAVALAEHNAGNEDAFVEKMNHTAKQLGLEHSHFSNATGLDYGEGFSTTRDLALLSAYLLKDDTIRAITELKSTEVQSTTGQIHKLQNTNVLLGELGIKGLKTGRTPAAGECLITLAENPSGNEILTVVLGSGNRFADTRTLVDWIYRAYIW